MRRLMVLAALALGAVVSSWPGPVNAEQAPPPKFKRVVQSIELSTKKSTPFTGRVWIGVVPSSSKQPSTGPVPPPLTYYWGGKCKGTELPPSRLEVLMQAMKEGYAVEIHAFPIEHAKTVVMCMQSVRISKD